MSEVENQPTVTFQKAPQFFSKDKIHNSCSSRKTVGTKDRQEQERRQLQTQNKHFQCGDSVAFLLYMSI